MNTIINNLFSFDKNNVKLDNNKEINTFENKQMASLYQGSKFIKYQDKIKENIDKTIKNNIKESFTSKNNSQSDIAKLQETYNKTLNEYNETLKKYDDLSKQMNASSSDYLARTNVNNKFLNKIIRFNTGQLYYVTNQGVAKYISDTTILKSISEKNGCPNTDSNYIDIDIQWNQEYNIEGTQLPTTPPLIIGKNMKLNESCGYEGSNVFVNTMLPSKPIPTYIGCFQDKETSTTMNFIGETPSSNSKRLGKYNFDQCEDAAILGGYQYFALQNVDSSTGLGYCAVSNNREKTKTHGNAYVFVPLWSSNTAGKPTKYAILTKNGTLDVCDSTGKSYFTTPNGTNCNQIYSTSWNIDAPGNDIRYVTGVRREKCEEICNSISNCSGFAWNRSNNNSCWLKSGKLSNITKNNKRILIKKTLDTSKCIYFLDLQNDGNMCIYKGEPNSRDLTNIWCSNTSGKQQKQNENYTVAKSKYGMTFLKNDQILNKGDWIVSGDGKLLLIMQNDGNLVLYTFKTNCANGTGDNSKNIYGGNLANALYDIGNVGIKSKMGDLAFIDADSQIHRYPSKELTYSTTYSRVIQNTNIQENDIPGAALSNVSDVTNCMNICNKYDECNAFVYDTTGPYPVCYPKKVTENALYSPNTFKPSIGKTVYVRDKKIINPPLGVDSTINYIDSIRYKNYRNQGGTLENKYGLANVISVQQQHLSQLQDKLNLLSSQLNNNVKKTQENILKKTEGFEGNQKFQDSVLQSIQSNNKINTLNQNNSEIDNILRDTNIKTLQQNYSYMLWSILALAVVIVTVKIKNTQM